MYLAQHAIGTIKKDSNDFKEGLRAIVDKD